MKPFITLFLFSLLAPLLSEAQQLEVRASLNSGFFSYMGDGAEFVSRINGKAYTNNPYGSRGGLSYGMSLNARKVTKSHFIYGADLGYEMLRSKVKLDYAELEIDVFVDYKGKTFLNTSFVNLYPYFGSRLNFGGQTLDLVGGLDIGYVLSSREKGEAISQDQAHFHVETSRDRKDVKIDYRPRIQLSTEFDKLGLSIGYSHGLRNYQPSLVGIDADTYSRMLRIGLSYRLK